MTRITVTQGQIRVSGEPRIELTTVLGSCVATCLFDPDARIGGMNHFLLAEPPANALNLTIDEHYGVYLMELLINEMLAKGASKSGLRAHLYGGANLKMGLPPIGTANAVFARRFLDQERIALIHEDLGGSRARRIDFRPAVGQARCRFVEDAFAPTVGASSYRLATSGDVELF